MNGGRLLTWSLIAIIVIALLFAAIWFTLPRGTDIVPDLDQLTVHFIDVGQGDSTLILTPSGQAMLIDAGPEDCEGQLLHYLQSYNVTVLEALVLTHPDSDHIGSADAVLEHLQVRQVIHPGFVVGTPSYENLTWAIENESAPVHVSDDLEEGQLLDILDDVQIRLLSAYRNASNSNEASLVLELSYGEQDMLFMGDADDGVEGWVLENYDLDVEVLKVSHHGSFSCTSNEFLAEVSPTYAIIFAGEGNDYGHPHQETLDRLHDAGAEILRTDIQGTIVLQVNMTSIIVYD